MSDKITITFPDGNTKSVQKGISGFELANQISKSLAKESVAIKINGNIYDLAFPINEDCKVIIIKRENDEALEIIRHDCAHVMAEAVQSLFPETQVTIGPSIENGFYYDFARREPFTVLDLPKIEKKMHEIISRGEKFTREVWKRDEAIKFFKSKGEEYKVELIEGLNPDEELTIKELVGKIADTMMIPRKSILWGTTKSDGCMKKTVTNKKFKSLYPDFKFTPLEEGLKYMYSWFNENYSSIRK